MFEKVNPSHPDKVADRIAGAIVDYAYSKEDNPKIAVEVLIGHGHATVIVESNVKVPAEEIQAVVKRLSGIKNIKYIYSPQDEFLAANQDGKVRCGDNGIFKGMPVTNEQLELTKIAKDIYGRCPYDGKYIIDGDERLVLCQSHYDTYELMKEYPNAIVNPLGNWTGGPDVDSGATNRKLGSDMGDGVTGGGLHGKDLSKADVSINIYAHLKSQETGRPVCINCAIGQENVDGRPYSEIVEIARDYIRSLGGFEKFAEWGLIR